MLMVGMEGSAVLAVRKVVVVAREAEPPPAPCSRRGFFIDILQQDSCNQLQQYRVSFTKV